jgi:hypothetical protein
MTPAVATYAGLALAAIGTGTAAYGQITSAHQQAATAKYNAELAERNAKSAKKNAEYEARQKRKETARLLGRQRALYGKAGVAMEGSPLIVAQETAAEGEMDALMIERGYAQKSAAYLSQAKLAKMRAKNYGQQGYWGAGSTLLTGAGQVATGYGGTSSAKNSKSKRT